MRVAMLLHKPVTNDSRVRREAECLVEAGHEVTVVQLAPRDTADLGFATQSALPPAWVRRGLPGRAYRIAFLAWFVRGCIAVRPDVVHAHDAPMLLPALLVRRLTGARIVYDSHELATGVPYRERGWTLLVHTLERLALRRCAAVITVSDGIADRLQARYALPRRPTVLRNVSALPAGMRAGGLRTRLDLHNRRVVLHQGSAANGRGAPVLIRAMAEVNDAELVFLGDDEPARVGWLRAQADAAGVGERVHVLPPVPLEELAAWTAEADVGVTLLEDTCENHRLALPNKLFEYISAGVPVVASDLPELRRMVDAHQIGWTVDPADPVSVARGLREALDSPGSEVDERLAAAAKALRWTVERERLIDLYADLERLGPADRAETALVLVRNDAEHDARVRREVGVLHDLGFAVEVMAVTSDRQATSNGTIDGAALTRLSPRSPLNRFRALARRRDAVGDRPPPPVPSAPRVPTPPTGSAGGRLRALALRAHRALATADYLRLGVSAVRARRPDVLHCNDYNTMWIGTAARVLTDARVVYDAHELWPDRNGRFESRPWLLACEALFVRVAHATITTSPGYADLMARRYRRQAPTVVRNIQAGLPSSPPARLPRTADPVAVYVGALTRGRGIERTIEVLARIPSLRLRLVGPGAPAYVAGLLRLAEDHGVADRLTLVEPLPPSGVVAAIADADFGVALIEPVCVSYELTLPNKLFEYVAAGLPMLASALPVLGETVRAHGLGETADPADLDSIEEAVQRILAGLGSDSYRANLARFAAENSWAQERRALVDVYSPAVSG